METEKLISQIENVVSDINIEIKEIINDNTFIDEFPVELECISNGQMKAIMFLGFRLWSSEDDERKFIPNTKAEAREPIRKFLVQEMNRIVSKVVLIGRPHIN